MKCIGCNTKECGACGNCRDMKKNGGPRNRKKACVKRACFATIKKIIQPAVSSCIINCTWNIICTFASGLLFASRSCSTHVSAI